jgi:DNA-binding NarL/FixJ family response regulator
MSEGGFAKPVRVMLVEDHDSFRQALAFLLNLEPDFVVASQASSLMEARTDLEEIDLAVVDLALPDGEGIELLEDLRRANPDVTVLILSATLNESNLVRAVESGADGILDKFADQEEIIDEMRCLRAGEARPRQEEVLNMLRSAGQQGAGNRGVQTDDELTARETEFLQALVEGLNSEKIAERLDVTANEEHTLASSVLEKLGARSRLQALAIAASQGIVEVP